MNAIKFQRALVKHSYLFSLLLLIIVLAVNRYYQPNMFELDVMNDNLRVFLPAIILAVGQTIVILAGGIDLSVGAVVTLINAILATELTRDSSTREVYQWWLICCGAGLMAGMFNGLCVSYLRLQPIVTTYATGFIYGGIALYILPRPDGRLPRDIMRWFREPYEGLPVAVYAIVVLILFWLMVRSLRYGQYIYATGSKDEAAYATGVPVNFVRFSSYMWSGLFAAIASIVMTFTTIGTGSPRIGDEMTLPSIVAVVLGGTRLSGGQGGIVGSIIGVLILGFMGNVISFAEVESWWRTLINALIIIAALAAPGIVRLMGKVREQWTR